MNLETAIEGLMKYRKHIHEQDLWDNPSELSDVMVKLATYNSYLADNLATLHHNATEAAGASFKAARDMEVGVTEAERFAKAESLEPRRKYEHAKYVYDSTKNLISVLQCRLRVISEQIKEAV